MDFVFCVVKTDPKYLKDESVNSLFSWSYSLVRGIKSHSVAGYLPLLVSEATLNFAFLIDFDFSTDQVSHH